MPPDAWRCHPRTSVICGFAFERGGGQLPFAETKPGGSFIFAFRALPLCW
jgi:hypothetical protein